MKNLHGGNNETLKTLNDMITFLLGVAVGAGIVLFQLPFLLYHIKKDEAREGEDRP